MEEILSPEEIERYHRQILLSELSIDGQLKLKSSKVLVVGAGGLGSPILLYLSGAGVGTLGIVDGDSVETINLHRQVIHNSANVKTNKAESARQAILALNPLTKVETYTDWLTSSTSASIIPKYDIIVIATDNIESRYLISDLGVFYKKPVISGSCVRWDGQLTVFSDGLCYRCMFPVPTPRKALTRAADVGVLGPIPGVIGTLQAVETIKLILGLSVLKGRMLLYDGLLCKFRIFTTRGRNPECPACSGEINPHTFDYAEFVGRSEVLQDNLKTCLSAEELEKLIEKGAEIIDVRARNHFAVSHLEKAKNVPTCELGMFDPFASSEPLVFVDRNGVEAAAAVERFQLQGVEARYLLGGLEAWKKHKPEFLLF